MVGYRNTHRYVYKKKTCFELALSSVGLDAFKLKNALLYIKNKQKTLTSIFFSFSKTSYFFFFTFSLECPASRFLICIYHSYTYFYRVSIKVKTTFSEISNFIFM